MKVTRDVRNGWAFLYVLYAVLLSAIVIWKSPPFTAADEFNHFRRANQVQHGEFLGKRLVIDHTVAAGGTCETNLLAVLKCFENVPSHASVKPDRVAWMQASQVRWGSATVPAAFENTAIYPPVFYLPQSAAIGVGKALDLPILATLQLARIANAICCIAVALAALCVARGARTYLFVLLLLPMTVALMATSTQDGLIIATAALASAILARAMGKDRALSVRELVAAVVCLTLVGITKAPYALLVFLPLLAQAERRRWLWAAVGSSIVIVAAWHLLDAAMVQTPTHRIDAVIDQHGQIQFLLSHPLSIGPILVRTLGHYGEGFVIQMIASLGAMDVAMPKLYFLLAFVVIGFSIATLVGGTGPIDRKRLLIGGGVLLVVALGIFVALYVSYTSVGYPYIEGLQGRYFLPLAAQLPVVLARKQPGESALAKAGWVRNVAIAFWVAFPIVSAVVVERALVARYF